MPTLRRRSSLAILAVLLAACSSASPTVQPTVAPAATSTAPAATAKATATATASPAPSLPTVSPGPTQIAGCAPIDTLDLSGIEVTLGSVDAHGNGSSIGFSVGPTNAGLQVARLTERSGQQRSVAPPPQELIDERGQILGGHDFITFPSTWFDGHSNPQAMEAARATLTLDSGTAIDLPTRFVPGNENFDQVAITVPDVAGPGSLLLEFVWADACFRYEGSRTIAVDVVPRSVTDGCVLDSIRYFEQLGELLRHSIRVESVPQHAFSPYNHGKFGPFLNPGIDAMIEYAFDPDAPAITAAPAAALRIERVSDDIALGDDMTLWVWTRSSVAKAIKDYPPDGTALVLSRTPVRHADGTFRLRVPKDPGRYVAGVELTYDSQCSSGTLWFMVNIDVVAP